jgi:hypothetical protein
MYARIILAYAYDMNQTQFKGDFIQQFSMFICHIFKKIYATWRALVFSISTLLLIDMVLYCLCPG